MNKQEVYLIQVQAWDYVETFEYQTYVQHHTHISFPFFCKLYIYYKLKHYKSSNSINNSKVVVAWCQ